MFKSSLTTSLIAGILNVSNLGIAQATTTEDKTADNRSPRAVSKIQFSAKNQSKTATVQKNFNSFGSVKTLTANLSSLPFKKHLPNASILNRTNVKLGSTAIDSKTDRLDSEFTPILANQNLANTSKSSTATLTVKPSRIHIVSRGDTINKIARRYGVSKNDLVRLNQIHNSNVIFVSQRLEIPTTSNSALTEALPNIPQQSDRVTSSIPTRVVKDERYKAVRSLKPNSDRYIANNTNKLRAEINQPPREQHLPQIQTLSVTTSVPLSNSQQNSLPKDSIALQLPPLPPEVYLPSAFEGYIWPAQGVLTSGYGWRWGRMHRGIDIAAPIGTPIVAAAAGEVIFVGRQRGYGNLVKVKHLDGSVTVYAHNHKHLVSHGQKVEQGEQIAEMGNTGRSTGPHVHFEIRTPDKVAIDPLALLKDR